MKTLTKHAKQRTQMPILNTILIHNGIARATDIDVQISAPVSIPDGLYVAETFGGLNLKSDLATDDFPQTMEKPVNTTSLTIDVKTLAWVAIAQSSEETRFYLNGIFFDGEKGALVATDGHRLHKANVAYSGVNCIVPKMAIKVALDIAKELKVNDVTFNIGTLDNEEKSPRIVINVGNHTIVSKHIDGTFPDYTRVIPSEFEHTGIAWDNGDIAKAFPDIKKLAKVNKVKSGHEKVKLNGEISAYGMRWNLSHAMPFDIGFNGSYLTDLDSGIMSLSTPSSPVLVQHSPDRLSVIMPMRLV